MHNPQTGPYLTLQKSALVISQPNEKKIVESGVFFPHQSSHLAAKDLHDTNLGAIEVKPSASKRAIELARRRARGGRGRGSTNDVPNKTTRRKKKTTKKTKKRPTKGGSKKKKKLPPKGKPKKCPANAPKTCTKAQKNAKGCCKPTKCPKTAPKRCSKKEKDPKTGCCKVNSKELEFTKYPKGKQHWTPPKTSKVARRSDVSSAEAPTNALAKRASHDVPEGKTVEGGATDSLKTWHVINCIAISGFDTATQKKAMAHINAVSATGKEYDDQFKAFSDIVYSWAGPVEITVRWPHKTAIPEDKKELKPKQKQFEDDIKLWVSWMRKTPGPPKFKVFDRPATKRQGDMVMLEEGDVSVE